jgi:hypothetical protein
MSDTGEPDGGFTAEELAILEEAMRRPTVLRPRPRPVLGERLRWTGCDPDDDGQADEEPQDHQAQAQLCGWRVGWSTTRHRRLLESTCRPRAFDSGR